MDAEKDQFWRHYKDAISSSAKLAGRGDNEEALRLLDGAIAMALKDNDGQWVLALSHHAAVISRFLGNLSRVKQYYEHSLALSPENPQALAGLADVAKQEGELGLANEYAARCYKSLVAGDDFLKEARLETLLKKWPELGRLKP
jgi:tetratricopeptide (TPR) repeat protein